MKFMKSRSISRTSNNDNNIVMGMKTVMYRQSNSSTATTIAQISKPRDKPTRLEWGTPIWTLFHTLIHKIKEIHYNEKSAELLTIIKIISANLPCPICTEHATKYLSSINSLSLKTKEDMKLMLFQFHNTVNERKGYTKFPLSELDSRYDNANTMNVINNFIISYRKKSRNLQLIALEMSKKKALEFVTKWLRDNIHIFEK